jgi:hypothetical protein
MHTSIRVTEQAFSHIINNNLNIPSGLKLKPVNKSLFTGMVSINLILSPSEWIEADTGDELIVPLPKSRILSFRKNPTESDRTKILAKFDKTSYYEYMDCLFSIYRELDNRRTLLSHLITNKLSVFGGMIYFALHREALVLGLKLENSLEYVNFMAFRTVDLDTSVVVTTDEDDFTDDVFEQQGQICESNFTNLMELEGVNMNRCFSTIESILSNKPLKDRSVKTVGNNLGVGFQMLKENGYEYRSQILARIGDDDDHIFELLLLINGDTTESCMFDLKSLKSPFLGENIITSVSEQVYPNERAWRNVNVNETSAYIFSQLETEFLENPLSYVKFRQGYYRICVMHDIVKKAYLSNIPHLSIDLMPSNKTFANKLFFFKSRICRTVVPLRIRNRMNEMYLTAKNQPETQANISMVLEFMEKCGEMWRWFDSQI